MGDSIMSEKTLNGWSVSRDSKNEVTGRDHFVVKRGFDKEGSGLSLKAKEVSHGYYQVELAIEVNNSVDSCFILENAASENEALQLVNDITQLI